MTDQTLPLCGDSGENPIAVLEAILTASLARYNRYNQTSARHTASAPPPPGPFVDIGCGRGKFVASACLLPGFSAAFSECKGIEIMPERVKQASQFLKAVETHPLLSQWLWRKRSSAAGAGSLAVGGGGRVRAMMTVCVCKRASVHVCVCVCVLLGGDAGPCTCGVVSAQVCRHAGCAGGHDRRHAGCHAHAHCSPAGVCLQPAHGTTADWCAPQGYQPTHMPET